MSAATTDTAPGTDEAPAPGLDPRVRTIFAGLMLGMLVASISQTIVSPAMPIIVAELGGMAHYSWLATAAMLVAAVVTPIVGKLSDLYGRRGFYIAGLVVFMAGSVLSGLAQDFWWLVGARAVQGAGMGILMPLSQTIIGDIIPPRQRGKYQGLMGAVFGFSSVAGPLAGGAITDNLGWRWLFFVTIPLGLAALVFIVKFLHLDHQRRDARVDVAGAVTLSVALVSILLATSWGGTSYPWASVQVVGLYVVGAVALAVLIPLELRHPEPILPLRMFRQSVFTFSAIASLFIAMVMFGAIFYIPVYAQGVLGVDATNSGLIVMPMSVAMIGTSMLVGVLITRTGRYKGFMVAGTLVLLGGYALLTRVHYGSSNLELSLTMVVIGLGLGACLQTYTLVVQNAVEARDMGVATAATQFFRNAGATVGVAVLGTVMTSQLGPAIGRHLPPGAGDAASGVDAGSVLDPTVLAGLPAPVAEAIRMGLADAMHVVFLAALPLAGLAVVATLFIKHVPLRDTLAPAVAPETESVPAAAEHALAGGEAAGSDEVDARHAETEPARRR
ncbi:MDR family MFS transporter [Auraticoccus monumenti]|uniref:Drug resistance transporter, EmrB/QacA subfamily n=1 Tax=Auraticoccus monumenti TaxID=675864 RepID=A0A1G7EC96_9ACTN|nr:MDR family MFS transporter [Auraticoccus monumenti]SDE61272.1 drug resistance transporter, EmrB/QacA subfamily [Auraticoccus monumenti]